MQKLLRQALVVSGLAALGIGSCARASYAGTATLQTSQTINIDCLFNNSTYTNTSGAVGYNSTGAIAQSITWTGTVGVTCNHSGNVQISTTPASTGGFTNGAAGAALTARNLATYTGEYLSVNGTNIWKNGSFTANSSVTLAPSANIPYSLALVTNPGTTGPGLGNGTYNYSFTLTATPN
ncbi:hypothetical protein [Anabaena sp. CCY 9910]|uniref:hypothetical protein n=1 Tax=Anabaena sp. CCY 9910 TaxID=3103870 RepID=UPI0039E0E872